MEFQKELVKGSIQNVVLAMLARGDQYGYQIRQSISEKTKGKLQYSEASVYPALHALENERFIRSYWAMGENGKERKYYALTKKGSKKLKEGINEWRQYRNAIDQVYSHLRISL